MLDDENAIFEDMRKRHESPIVQDFFHHVTRIAGFSLPPSFKGIFDAHRQHFFTDPQPTFMANYGEAPNKRWQKLYMESVFGSSQSAAAAVFYHYENLIRIERQLLAFRDIERLVDIMGNSSTMAGGNTQKLDFEYHGFVFAYRRTLDYLARGVAALLHQDFKSFRRLPDFLENHTRHAWVYKLIEIHAAHTPNLDTFLGNRTDKSTRDQIAHYIHVPAGCLNVNVDGVYFVGGGEGLDRSNSLATVTNNYIQTLQQLLGEFLPAIASGFPKQQRNPLRYWY